MLMGQAARVMRSAPDDDEYVEVELRLRAGAGQGTTAAELRAMPGHAYPETAITVDADRLTGMQPGAYGEALGRQLFDGTVLGGQFAELRTALDARGAPWRLRLRLDDPALQPIHWERLCYKEGGKWQAIGAGGAVPFSRYVYVDGWKPARPLTDRPVLALFVSAAANDSGFPGITPIGPAERDAMRAALGAAGGREIDVQELATGGARRPDLAELRGALAAGPAIVHVLCHGLKGPDGTALLLEDQQGRSVAIPTHDLLDAIRGAASAPRLVVLAACDSAATDGARAFVPLGLALAAEGGVDAVVAMTAPIATDTARDFCGAFYQRLFTHGVVDRALNEARAAVRDAWDWSVPVLFSRLADQQLLDFAVGRVHARYLDLSERVTRDVAAARASGEAQGIAGEAIEAMNLLIAELEKSHEVLTKLTTEFRRTARDPVAFPAAFRAFRSDFKEYYDNQSWRAERTRCHAVQAMADPVRDLVRDVLSPEEFARFTEDVSRLSSADGDIIQYLGEFVDRMDSEVDEIAALLDRGDEAAALARHRSFDLQISPSFRKSKALLAEIGERVHRVSAA